MTRYFGLGAFVACRKEERSGINSTVYAIDPFASEISPCGASSSIDTIIAPFISNEYDIQDLLHGLLKSLYDDVRPEEYAPSYAGGSSRLDFLLKREQIVIEVKMANEKLRDRMIGEQLVIDIKRYQTHPDCKALLCFVYDPGGFVKNAAGLESDLSGKHNALDVRVLVLSL